MQYRRSKDGGATYFFTVVTHNRSKFLCNEENVELLRSIMRTVMVRHPFVIDAMIVMPDHLHTIWTLPEGDNDFPMRWNLIKREFSRRCDSKYKRHPSESRVSKGEQTIWQRRYWEHLIRDDDDFIHHVEYIHYNPVKHGYVTKPGEWRYSSFHRYVNQGVYASDWGNSDMVFDESVGNE